MYPWRLRQGDDPGRRQKVLTITLHLTSHNTSTATKSAGGGEESADRSGYALGTVLLWNYLELKTR